MQTIQPNAADFQPILKIFFEINRHRDFDIEGFKGVETIIKYLLLTIKPRFDEIKKRFDLDKLTMGEFYRICEAEEIEVGREKLADKHYGYYRIDKKIRLRKYLRGKWLLMVAAHELAHHFLHREKMISGVLGYAGKRNPKSKSPHSVLAELEADFLAAMLITGL